MENKYPNKNSNSSWYFTLFIVGMACCVIGAGLGAYGIISPMHNPGENITWAITCIFLMISGFTVGIYGALKASSMYDIDVRVDELRNRTDEKDIFELMLYYLNVIGDHYENRIKAIRDEIARTGFAEQKGIEKGMEKGKIEMLVQNVSSLLANSIPLEQIVNILNISNEDLKVIKPQLS